MKMNRRQFLRFGLGTTLGGAALLGAGYAQSYGLSVTRHTLPLSGLTRPLKVVFLTDLHYGLYVGLAQVQAWVKAANAERPDLILLGGDYLDIRPSDSPAALLGALSALQAPLGCYGVWGNHDYGSFGRYDSRWRGAEQPNWQETQTRWAAEFAQAGIILLNNQGAAIGQDMWLAGVDDWMWGHPDAQAATLAAQGRATVLLSHNPDILPELPSGIGLVLSGHTHGGQIRLPVLGAPVVPSAYGQRYAQGWVRGAHDTPAYVSRGLGTTGLPLRNLCPPEITVLQLQPGPAAPLP